MAEKSILQRHSIRGFLPDEIDRTVLDEIVQTALLAPSWHNSQPCKIFVLSGKTKEAVSKKMIEDANNGVPISPDIPIPGHHEWPPEIAQRMRDHTITRMKYAGIERHEKDKRWEFQLKMYRFLDAPHVIFLGLDQIRNWSLLDVGFAMQNIMIAANAAGLGTCPQATAAFYPDRVREVLQLNNDLKIIVGLAIGYPDVNDMLNQYHADKVLPEKTIAWYE
jgi:nitroreductase